MSAAVEETTYQGEPAVRLSAGTLSATFLPHLGLTGVSLQHEGGEHLAVPGGLDALREGRTTGFPLVAPWVNRLSAETYTVDGVRADVTEAVAAARVRTDGNGLPIHGFICGRSEWTVVSTGSDGDVAHLRAELDVDDPAFPFPHRIAVVVVARHDGLDVDTTVTPLGDRAVPLVYGWHPYLTVPGTPRERWRLRTPAWKHLTLDARGIPTGEVVDEPAADEPIGTRLFDDLYAFDAPLDGTPYAGKELAFVGEDGRSITVRCGSGYGHAQVWVPAGKDFAALEPMAAPTDALVSGAFDSVPPEASIGAAFSVDLTGPTA